MKKAVKVFLSMSLLVFMVGCSSNSQNPQREFYNASSSYFEHITWTENDDVYIVEGTVHNENDGNAVITYIQAEADTKINISGTLERKDGADTKIIYVAPDGTESKISDNSSEAFETSLDVVSGEGIVRFEGEPAVYDFRMEFEVCDGISYSDR